MQLNEAVGRYRRVLIGRMAASSAKTYASRMRYLVSTLRSETALEDIRLPHLEEVVATYRASRAPNSTALLVTALKQFFSWCVEVELLDKDPSIKLRAPRRTPWLPRSLSEAMAQSLLTALTTRQTSNWRDLRNEALIRVLLYTGLRRAEIAALQWSDIDIAGRVVTVNGKGGRLRRLPLHPLLPGVLIRLQTAQGRSYGAVFASQEGVALHPYTINAIFRRWVKRRTGIAIGPHRLRHSFATFLVERGASLDEVRDLLGHVSVVTTQGYVAMSAERLRGAVERLP